MGHRGERGPDGDSARQGEAEPGDRGAARGAVGGLEPVHAGSDQVAQPSAEGGRVNGQRQAGQPERDDDRPPGRQVGDDGQQRRPGRPLGAAEHPGAQDAEAGRVRHQHRGDGHRDSPAFDSPGLGLAERLVEGLAQQRRVVRAHLEREMLQRRAPVRAGGQRVAHQRRGVTGPGSGGLVAPGPAVPLPPQPPLAVQVLHDRHHGGVRQRPVVMQSVDHLAHQHRPLPLPQTVHDHGFQLTETSHPHSRTWHANGASAAIYYHA